MPCTSSRVRTSPTICLDARAAAAANLKRPLGVPCTADRALQRSAAEVLSAIYERDFLPCSLGGRPGRGAHQALASLHEVISGRQVEWVLEADLKNFFGSISHEWMLRFVEHRVGDPRLISLIRRWLKASILEDGEISAIGIFATVEPLRIRLSVYAVLAVKRSQWYTVRQKSFARSKLAGWN
jgi:Reverse transcriptase (RNA-dependent DNA polymerase)